EVAAVIRALADAEPRRQAAVLNGLAEGMSRRATKLGDFLGSLPEAETARAVLSKAGAVAADAARPMAERLDAIKLLVHVPWEASSPVLSGLLAEEQPQEIRIAAVAALSAQGRPEVAKLLMGTWKKALPALR